MTARASRSPEHQRGNGVPLLAWLVPLLLLLAVLLWFLEHRTRPTVPAPAASATAAEPAQQTGSLPVLATIRFDTTKTELSNDAKEELDRIAELMRQDRHIHLRLQGYVDATDAAARKENLLHERAGNVADYLQRKGVETTQLTGEGFAAADSTDSSATGQSRADRLRVEFFRTQ